MSCFPQQCRWGMVCRTVTAVPEELQNIPGRAGEVGCVCSALLLGGTAEDLVGPSLL